MTYVTPSGAGVPMTLVGKEVTVEPLSLGDWDELVNWAKSEIAKQLAATLTDDSPNALVKEVVSRIESAMSEVAVDSDQFHRKLETAGGFIRLIYFSVRRSCPELTYEDVCRWNLSTQDMNSFNSTFKKLNTPPGKNGSRKKKARRT